MIRKRLGRLATVLTAGSMALLLLGVGSAAAKNPTWSITAVKLPSTVGAGRDAGYFVTVRNAGTSNINAATLKVIAPAGAPAAPTYFSGLMWNSGGPGSCTTSGQLVCNLGTMPAGTTITFTVALHVPTGTSGTFDATFSLESASGNTGSDSGHNSRGDALIVTSKTAIGSGSNFDGGFSVNGSTTYSTNQSVGRNNKQASTVVSPNTVIPVTVEDGITSGVACTAAKCSNAFGEWTVLHVNDGATFGNAFKVTLLIWGGSVPGGVSTSDVVLLHTLDNGTTETISQACTPSTGTPTNAECITVTKVGNNFQIVAWLFKNGGIRGGF